MLEIGASFILYWLLIDPLKMTISLAALIVGIVFVVLAFLLGSPSFPKRT